MSGEQPVLDVRGLTVSLPPGGERPNAVEDVSFSVNRGETLCIVGESGSGKSISGQAVFGLLPRRLRILSGSARLSGRELLDLSPPELRCLRGPRMSMIFQEPMTALNPVWPVGDQIGEMFRIHTDLGATARRKRVLEMLEKVRLPDPERTIERYPHQLSGGQRQRVMIAMALALEPELIFADEPTTALDVTTQARILGLLRELQASHGTALVFVTHDFGVVAEIADRVVVMNKGQVVEGGRSEAVLSTPSHFYTRTLIDAVPRLAPREARNIDDRRVVLETRSLSKSFNGSGGLFRRARRVDAVQDVSISLRHGETLGIVGESGSGKTTLARLLMRLQRPSSGDILLEGTNIAGLSGPEMRRARKDIQIVFQDPYGSLNPRTRVGDIIARAAINHGASADAAAKRAAELLTLVGLGPEAAHRYPHQFSGGQRQRIGIARALSCGPKVLIADEAVSALDVSVQAQVLDLLADLRARLDLSMVFVTHDLRVAARIADRIAVMQNGRVVECGPTAEVFAAPRAEYTKALLAAAPGRGWRETMAARAAMPVDL